MQHHSVSAVLCSLRCRGRSGLFIAVRMQSHSHSAERLLLFKAHNNRTKSLKWGSLGLCTQSPTEYQSVSFLVVYLCGNDAALSDTSLWAKFGLFKKKKNKEAILIVGKSVGPKHKRFSEFVNQLFVYKLLHHLVFKLSITNSHNPKLNKIYNQRAP